MSAKKLERPSNGHKDKATWEDHWKRQKKKLSWWEFGKDAKLADFKKALVVGAIDLVTYKKLIATKGLRVA